MNQLHYIQDEILRKLSMTTQLKFNELLIDGLESEHMNYHLKKLIELKYVIKKKDRYELTDLGKDYTNLIDDNRQVLEKQPKTSVIIRGVEKDKKTGEILHLLNKRLKQPYFGKIGRIGGKVKFGETFTQAALRELYEETGLKPNTIILERIYHKLRHREDGEFVQDVIFYIFFATDFVGEMIKKLPYQENFWVSKKEVSERNDLDFYDDLVLEDLMEAKPLKIEESVNIAEGY
jgi:ADP-ribose pyrophosphatase YjhB (NUDIX family)